MAPQETNEGEVPPTPPRRLRIIVNSKVYTIGPEIPKETTLVDFLRNHVKLPGTKVLCREGGCGLCTVVATIPDPERERGFKTFSVHACQLLVYACGGWAIETIEHLGNRYDGYHTLQKALTGFYGTQCGYCSPGMIMTMYGQLKSSGSLTSAQVEESLDGNLCRCTGYRPILDAFKSLSTDGEQRLKEKLVDIEDANKATCPKTGTACSGRCPSEEQKSCSSALLNGPDVQPEEVEFTDGGSQWYRPVTLLGVRNALKKVPIGEKFYIIVGYTGTGVYKDDGPYTTYISTNNVKELYNISTNEPLVLGANVPLTRAIEVFEQMSNTSQNYKYLETLAAHWKLVANVSVRNIGSWAGNLMLKHKHHEFPSDLFLTLLAANAQLSLMNVDTGATTQVDLEAFLRMDMSRSFITSISLLPMDSDVQFRTYKITPRAVNAHAYVNACFKMRADPSDGFMLTEMPTIVYGGINPDFIHAKQTESFLRGKRLTEVATIVKAAQILGNEIKPDAKPQDASPEYRKSLAQSLLYKAIVSILGDKVGPEIWSAGTTLTRPISTGVQDFDANQQTWPVGKAIPKVESATQISGEAVYLDDIPMLPGELHGAFVQTKYANAKIKSIDASAALREPGVVDFVKASDIPGTNSFYLGGSGQDPIFIENQVNYAGQSIGLVVAEDQNTAKRAAKLVVVEYEDIEKPVLTIEEALQEGKEEFPVNFLTGKPEPYTLGDVEAGFKDVKHKLMGELHQGSQFHLTMEAIAARVVPIEDGYDVYSTSQWPTQTQATVAEVLGIPSHSINVTVRRIGGGYGGKITRQHVVSTAAAVASHKLRVPVRVAVDLNTHMKIVGWREPYLSKYEVGFDDNGKLQALKVDVISDGGHVPNEVSVGYIGAALQNTYLVPNMLFRPIFVRTNTAANTWCRTPGTVEALATIENILEHIANYLKKDPMEVRLVNMFEPQVPRLMAPPLERNVVKDDILPLLKEKAMYEQRKQEVEIFNKENRWKKRGISIIPLLYGLNYPSMFRYGIQVSIYEHDGTVAVSHGGIEMGQGINTKVAQVAAYVLGIPIDKVIIKATDTTVGANSIVTGGSFGTDICCHGTKIACEALRKRIDEVKEKIKDESEDELSWEQLIKKCHAHDVDLCERYWTSGKEHPRRYDIWAGCCLEVEIDVLTGQYLLRRADIVEDCGRSMNPFVDIGQVEGAFIMGIGLYTSELVKFDLETGVKLSDGTWEYKPPTALDIPVDMRVTLLPNANNPYGVLGSKATGEPALCFSYVVVTALRHAIAAFRAENGNEDWFEMNTPITVEKVHQLCGVRPDQFRLSKQDDDTVSEDFQVVGKEDVPAVDNEGTCSMN